MASIEGVKRSAFSVHNYPEHLNPFSDDDHHSQLKQKFWTMGRSKGRRSSFSASLKDFRNTLTLKSFRKKERKSPSIQNLSCVSAQNSPEVYRKRIEVSDTESPVITRKATERQSERYVYGGSFTPQPLPRFRFQERFSSLDKKIDDPKTKIEDKRVTSSILPSHRNGQPFALPGMTSLKNADTGSRSSLQTNPFEETADTTIRSSTRKKRRAPPPPASSSSLPPIPNIIVTDTEEKIIETVDKSKVQRKLFADNQNQDLDINDPTFTTELKIIEDDESKKLTNKLEEINLVVKEKESADDPNKTVTIESIDNNEDDNLYKINVDMKISDDDLDNKSIDNELIEKCEKILESESLEDDVFKKVDIVTYTKQISLESNKVKSDETESDKIKNGAQMNGNETDSVKMEIKEVVSDQIEPRAPIACEDVYEDNYAASKIDFDMAEFKEFDCIIKEMESSSHNNGMQDKNESNNINIYDTPNPIPKPRRLKSSKSSLNESIKSSVPSSPEC